MSGENLAVHMHSHMLLQVLSVKETTWKGTLQQARSCRKMLRRGIGNPSQDSGTAPIHAICKQHPSAHFWSLQPPLSMYPMGVMSPLNPGPSSTEDTGPWAAATWLRKADPLQSLRKQEGKVLSNSKRSKLMSFCHLSFKNI